jgi:hypothetical protein
VADEHHGDHLDDALQEASDDERHGEADLFLGLARHLLQQGRAFGTGERLLHA